MKQSNDVGVGKMDTKTGSTWATVWFLLLFGWGGKVFAQDMALIAYNGPDDAIAIVALENISSGENYYFTDAEHDGGNVFESAEGVGQYITPGSGLSVGDVIVITETSSSTFGLACNIGGTPGTGSTCGATVYLDSGFSLPNSSGSVDEEVTLFTDSDGVPSNGVTQIHSIIVNTAGIGTNTSGYVAPGAQPDDDPVVILQNFGVEDANLIQFLDSPREVASLTKGSIIDALEDNIPGSYSVSNSAGSTVLSATPFTAAVEPVLTLARSPASVAEDGATNLVYTFTLNPAPASDVTVNFNVGGTATFTTDYSVSGAASFNASTGTVEVTTSGSANVTIDPIGDSDVELPETVVLTPVAGTGYTGGSSASGILKRA